MREEARDFRLISTALSPESRVRTRAEEQEKLSQGSIQTIHQQLYYNLDLLRAALGLQTCALLWLDEAGERLKVKELCTDSTHVVEGAIAAGGGVLGAILKELRPFTLEVAAAVAAAVLRGPGGGGRVPGRAGRRGAHGARHPGRRSRRRAQVRAGRRRAGRPAPPRRWCASCSPSACSRRSSARSTSTSASTSASAELNRALTLDQVYDAAIAGARGVCEFDFAAHRDLRGAARQPHDPARGGRGRRQAAGHVAQGSVVDRVDGGEEQAGAARGRRLARARRAGVLAPDAHQGLRIAAGGAADREGRGDRHVHGRGDARGRVPERSARHAGRHRQPGRGLDAERAHVRGAGGAGDDRRPDRPGQPPHVPGALLDDAGPRRAPRAGRCRCC